MYKTIKKNNRMASVNPYLTFKDNCEQAFEFYKSVFGGEFAVKMRFGEMPSEFKVAESDRNRITHISLPIGHGTILMGSDMASDQGELKAGQNFSISVNADSKEEADRLFNGLAAGGKVTMPLAKAFWGSYFGMLVDKFGVQWMMSFGENQEKQ